MKFLQIKSAYTRLAFLCVLSASAVNCFALDREAFTFTSYDLNVQVDPEQHREHCTTAYYRDHPMEAFMKRPNG